MLQISACITWNPRARRKARRSVGPGKTPPGHRRSFQRAHSRGAAEYPIPGAAPRRSPGRARGARWRRAEGSRRNAN
eukprot:9394663-Pyramimonas_sp.AAC.1